MLGKIKGLIMANRQYFVKGLFVIICILAVFLLIKQEKQNYPFTFIGSENGQSVFLDGAKGKVVYIDNNKQITDYIDLRPGLFYIYKLDKNKSVVEQYKDWDPEDIPGTNYTLRLSTRFYNNQLLYTMVLTPFDDGAMRFANTISVSLCDDHTFVLENINARNWFRRVDQSGEPTAVNTQGSIPITLKNYLEIQDWYPQWNN